MNTLARSAIVCAGFVIARSLVACATTSEPDAAVMGDRSGAALSLDVDATQTTASGLSSGAFMAVQFTVAFSASTKGVAAFAGGPYACARGSVAEALTTCMSSSSVLDPGPFVALTRANAKAGAIDAVDNLASHRVFLFGGDKDTTVNPAVMDGLRAYYGAFVTDSAVAFVRKRPATAHTMPTESYGSACATTASPYVGNCGYDGAGAALAHLHGPLAPRAASTTGEYWVVPQGSYVLAPASHSLADNAFVYVPSSCAAGERCRVHVAFHGCQQSVSAVGDAFYKHAGYNEWADTNHLVIVYPQTIATKGNNPNGCWDWWGYDSPDYANKSGPQMKMVKALVDAIASGASFGDAGAGEGSTKDSGATDAAGGDAGAQTTAKCVTASNIDHVVAGRARAYFGFAFAAGSGQSLGLASALVRTTLKERERGTYVLSTCSP